MQCDLDKLRNLINENNLEKVNFCIESICERQEYVKYHFFEYKWKIDAVANQTDAFRFVLSGENDLKIALKANIVALLQNLHAIQDILGHLISYSLELSFGNERHINLVGVKKKLDEFQDGNNLVDLIKELSSHDDAKYLNAIVNVSKHRYLIFPRFFVHFDTNWHGYKFLPFEYDSYKYPEREIHEFIIGEYDREGLLVIQIQNELIAILEKN